MCTLGRIVGSDGFSAQFIKIISHCGKIGCGIGVLQRAACLVVGLVTVGGFAFLFGCTLVAQASGSVVVPAWGLVCWWDGGGLVLWLFVRPAGDCLLDFFCSGVWFYLLCVLVFALSPCCVLIYMF